jgi:soluble lytic murein transglycosylase
MELFNVLFRRETLPPPVLASLKKEAPDMWNKTHGLIAGPENREKALSLFFSSGGGLSGEALSYIREELQARNPGFFTSSEEAAIDGHLAVSRSSFAEGLGLFRPVLEEDRALFFRFPELLNDLGRCFQYTPAGNEGIDLFLAWEAELAGTGGENLSAGGTGPVFTAPDQREAARFRLLFFAGRMSRQRGALGRGAEFFSRALVFAPDALQEDACIWYILDASLQTSPETAAALTMTYLPRWNDGAYFSDILDRLAHYLTANRNWADLAALLEKMREPGLNFTGPSVAQYAYITGRALSEGLFVPGGDSGLNPEEAGDSRGAAFFRLAYNTGGPSPYYRALGASLLGEPFLAIPARPPREPQTRSGNRELMEFLSGFFEYGAASFAFPAIMARKEELSIPELRRLAAALGTAGLYPESIRLAAAYMERPDYKLNRADLRLSYPRPFQKIIGENAGASGLPEALVFALVRTESAFQPDIVSHAGALGLAQLMPATAADMANRIKNRGGPDYTGNGGPDLRDPAVNVHIGSVYLRYLTDQLQSPFLALLAYNGGINRVRRWRGGEPELPADLFLETIPYSETREYGRKVLSAALMYGYLYYDLKTGPFFSDMFIGKENR